MKVEPTVSVIIPTYNRRNLVMHAIESVLTQTYQALECLVVDDASTDDTKEWVEKINDSRVRYICLHENTKGTGPRNRGITESKGKYIAFLDSDDEWHPLKLEKQVQFMEECSKGNVCCFTEVLRNKGNHVVKRGNQPFSPNERILDYILVGRNVVQTSTFMLPSEIAKQVMFSGDCTKHQDWDFLIRLKKRGVTFRCLHEALTKWNVEEERVDRKSKSVGVDVSLSWFEENKEEFSDRGKLAFFAHIVAPHWVEQHKFIRASGIYLQAFLWQGITFRRFYRGIGKIGLVIARDMDGRRKRELR